MPKLVQAVGWAFTVVCTIVAAFIGLGFLVNIFHAASQTGAAIDEGTRGAAIVGMFIVAAGLHRFKRLSQLAYGYLEVCFAAVSTWYVMAKFSTDMISNAVAVVGAVYLMTRGIANVSEAGRRNREQLEQARQ